MRQNQLSSFQQEPICISEDSVGEEAERERGTVLCGKQLHLGRPSHILLLLRGLPLSNCKNKGRLKYYNICPRSGSGQLPLSLQPGVQGAGDAQHQEVDGDPASEQAAAEGLHDLLQKRVQNSR